MISQRHRRPLLVKIGLCSLNNDPLCFQKNYDNIIKSIQMCKQKGCKVRAGGELQIPGYACNDHFNEYDTTMHSWELIAKIIKSGITQNIICNIGTAVNHHGTLYNTLIVLLNNKVIGIRPKIFLADGDGYFQSKWFGSWKQRQKIQQFKLPKIIQEVTDQKVCPIGEFIIDLNDTMISFQICEEAWFSQNPMINSTLDGAQIIINPSASYSERGKLKKKLQMLKQLTQRHGGCYCYVNIKGTVGERTYFQGECVCTQNGKIKAVNELNTLEDVSVTEVLANITSVRTFRLSKKSFGKNTNGVYKIPHLKVDFDIADCEEKYTMESVEEKNKIEKLLFDYQYPSARWQPSLFLWDYLRKTNGSGFFLALSGGLDSCSVALIVYNMCVLVYKQIKQKKNQKVLEQLRRMTDEKQFNPKSAEEICSKLLFTAYMATQNSSQETRIRAELIAKTINCNHRFLNFDQIFHASQQIGKKSLGIDMNFKKNGGTWRQDLALQNIQARTRMMLAYMFAQLELQVPKKKGFLLVLGSSNLDESLRGYFTKYDCSSADINPIGSFSKMRLRQFLQWNHNQYNFQFITKILQASPSAELQPLLQGQIAQTDEEDMGLTYKQLQLFGKLRRVHKFGPVSMFQALYQSQNYTDIRKLAQGIKKFFRFYSINRHKMTIMTPAFHYDPESCDDHRYDMRPLFYLTDWEYQFNMIDDRLQDILSKQQA